MKKYMQDLVVKETVFLNNDYVLIKLTQDQPLPEMQPGQFVEIRVDNSPSTFLRRPISIHDVDYKKNELSLLIQQVGEGTKKIAEVRSGEKLNLLFPLGKPFTINKQIKKALLIGGGVGVAPLLFLGRILKEQGIAASYLLGARSAKHLLQLKAFAQYGTVHLMTEDGSIGEKGLVTEHSILEEQFDMIYTCGPTPMMRAVARLAAAKKINCEVSQENTMACGIGACLCCVTETKEGHKCVCTEGPVFNINELNW